MFPGPANPEVSMRDDRTGDTSHRDLLNVPTPAEAVEEVREPEIAREMRVRDTEETEEKLSEFAAAQQQTAQTLKENEVAIERTNEDRRELENSVEGVKQAAREVDDGIAQLNRSMKETVEAADWKPPRVET
jgi:septal ring factor EnvC (AmiA/AmiB activator)